MSRGEDFEVDVRRSLASIQGVAEIKLKSAVPFNAFKDAESAARFTPKQPYDLQVSAPIAGAKLLGPVVRDIHGGELQLSAKGKLVFALEVKSTKEKSFPFRQLKPHQEEGLRKVGTKGHVAGLIIEFQSLGGAVYFLPIENYIAFRLHATGASIPATEVQKLGILIELDAWRMRRPNMVNTYYRMAKFLRLFGADVEAEEEEF